MSTRRRHVGNRVRLSSQHLMRDNSAVCVLESSKVSNYSMYKSLIDVNYCIVLEVLNFIVEVKTMIHKYFAFVYI